MGDCETDLLTPAGVASPQVRRTADYPSTTASPSVRTKSLTRAHSELNLDVLAARRAINFFEKAFSSPAVLQPSLREARLGEEEAPLVLKTFHEMSQRSLQRQLKVGAMQPAGFRGGKSPCASPSELRNNSRVVFDNKLAEVSRYLAATVLEPAEEPQSPTGGKSERAHFAQSKHARRLAAARTPFAVMAETLRFETAKAKVKAVFPTEMEYVSLRRAVEARQALASSGALTEYNQPTFMHWHTPLGAVAVAA